MLEQFGFSAKYSTQHQLLRVTEFFSENLNSKCLLLPSSQTSPKSFTKLKGLIYILIRLNIPSTLAPWQSQLSHPHKQHICTTLYYMWHNSGPGPVSLSVDLYYNDIPRTLLALFALYADDQPYFPTRWVFTNFTFYTKTYLTSTYSWSGTIYGPLMLTKVSIGYLLL